ncbi:AMP-dependent synthetase/ligase [Streptomyces panaciradicis]|uniref:AMP-dependent synthetase/ligase n=1 Tax=Streptomyces panaciradicis TaxID=1470261 RepID=UPI00201CDA12|nr:long-chain fatty acid--CoA ligase [Streptomyces panaciradicis]MCL6667277.1 long-chain fatty acid--CoA ligase [Streptomyces panaciradicis]
MEEPSHARTWYTPAKYVTSPRANATDDIVDNALHRPGHEAFARKADGGWRTVTSRAFADEVMALAAGLMAAGIAPGDRIALMSGSRYEWMLCDFAIWTAGAVSVPVYETSSAEQVEWILRDSGARAAFVEGEERARVVTAAEVASVRQVWRLDGGLGHLVELGRTVPPELVERRRRAVGADALATVVYTSGTTGRPRGCLISHGNLVAEVRNVAAADGITENVLTDRTRLLVFLPPAHVLARVVALAAVHNGAQVAHTSDLGNLTTELRTYRPTLLLAVPRIFEKLRNTAQRTAVAGGHARMFRAAEATAVAYSEALDHGGPGLWLRARHRVFDRLVLTKLRAALGGHVAYACSGGAPLGAALGHFMRGAGVTVLEGWGLTETASGVTLNLPGAQRVGSVGRPLPGCAVRIGPGDEVLVKGPNVFGGYLHDEEATAEAFDEEGWLRTGDVGQLDDGYLTITGRKKDLIVTAVGKNVAPAPLEDRLRAHWLIDQCVLVGDRRPYIGALITLDPEFVVWWGREHDRPRTHGVAELRDDPELRSAVQAAVDEANRTVSAAESIRRFRILSRGFAVGEELTPSQKVRRGYVAAKFAADIEALYAPPGPKR